MDRSEIAESEGRFVLPTPSHYMNVGIAINGNKNSKYIVRWALDKFVPEGNVAVKLIHVRSKIVTVPTATAYVKEMDWQTSEMLLPYQRMCAQRKVEVEIVVVESDDVVNAIAAEVAKFAIKKLVIGAPSHSMFTRKPKGLSSKISASTPSFCTVYEVSKGKLSSIRPSDSETVGSSRDDDSDTRSIMSETSYASSTQTENTSVGAGSNFHSPSLTMQRFQALATINQNLLKTRKNSSDSHHSRFQSLDLDEGKTELGSCPSISESQVSSCWSLVTDNRSCVSDEASTSDAVTDYSPSESKVNINFELEKLRIELRHVKGIYAMAQSETNDASRKLKDLSKRLLDDSKKLEEITAKEEEANELAREEKEKHEATKIEAERVKQCAEREAALKKEAGTKAMHDAKEKEKLENALAGLVQQHQNFSWEEIIAATSSFSEDLKIGLGGYGTVYKGSFHHTTAAVKVLHSKESRKTKQFHQELEILSQIHHPHLLLLIGACIDHGCLVYEYMENGSLEDRLMQKNGTPPIPWFDRYRIAWEVASALAFLHNSKPKPIIHRDLKPANILLDHNLVSKIGDVGLAAMLQSENSSISTMYRDTGPVGTLCYIDPEYQRTGLISPKSDVYAFGMVILQLLTGRPAIALAHVVETAVADGNLMDILDKNAGNWPVEETKTFAELGLSCVELRRRDRPDLQDQVLPSLQRLKEAADKARDSASKVHSPPPPNHFICPILKDVMNDPCAAADGYTYDRKAIETWIEGNDTSPMTNLPLPSKSLIPNYTLLSAIMEWKSKRTTNSASTDC